MSRFYVPLFALISVACSRVEPAIEGALCPDTPFQITATTTPMTRGTIVSGLSDMVSMGIFCARTDDEPWSTTAEFTKLYNQRYLLSDGGKWEIDGKGGMWGYSTLEDLYTFYGYSPHSGDTNGVTARVEAGAMVVDYAVPAKAKKQPDLLFAVPRKDITPDETGGVSLKYFHALSCVSFGVVSSIDVKITAIKVTGVVDSGTLSWDDSTNKLKWSLDDSNKRVFKVEVSDYELDGDSSADVTADNGYLMMIPQLLSSGAQVTLTLDNGTQKSLLIPVNSEWEAGKSYHYIINLCETDCGFIFNSDQVSNCYIINPIEGEPSVIQIPIEGRINDFWVNYVGEGAKIKSTSEFSEFTVMWIWDDFADPISFSYEFLYDASGGLAVQLTLPSYFTDGNLLFSIQKGDEENGWDDTLWSWHLWFTDYDPDALAAANRSKIEVGEWGEFGLTGYEGEVHRYVDGSSCDAVWSDLYSDKFIMDRNIGSRSSTSGGYGAGSVYYQFGRKDPFPGSGGLYYTGKTSPSVRSSSGFSFDDSVIYLKDFFANKTSSSDSWCDETESRSGIYVWFDSRYLIEGYVGGKSIFDPSPLGWCIPVKDTWGGFSGVSDAAEYYEYYGYRDGHNKGTLCSGSEECSLWSSTPCGAERGYSFSFGTSQLSTSVSRPIRNGYPIRAIEE